MKTKNKKILKWAVFMIVHTVIWCILSSIIKNPQLIKVLFFFHGMIYFISVIFMQEDYK